jgi:hypothetical protein
MSIAQINNLTIERGTDFEVTFDIFTEDFGPNVFGNGYSGIFSIKKYPGATTAFQKSVVFQPGTNDIKVSLAKTETSTLKPGRNYFQLSILSSPASGSLTNRVVEGTIIVSEEITSNV